MTIPTFPTLPGIAFPVRRTPMWKTVTQESVSGKDYRIGYWTYPRYQWEVSFEMLRSDQINLEWQHLQGLFNQVSGSMSPFHWSDPNDKAVTGQGIGTGNGSTKAFNFFRALGNFAEPVQDVVASGLNVYVSGVLKTLTTDYTLLTDPQWGLIYGVNFVSAPANAALITADFSYNWACRFDDDNADFTQFMYQVMDAQKLVFTSIKVI